MKTAEALTHCGSLLADPSPSSLTCLRTLDSCPALLPRVYGVPSLLLRTLEVKVREALVHTKGVSAQHSAPSKCSYQGERRGGKRSQKDPV